MAYPVTINSHLLPTSSGVLHQHTIYEIKTVYEIASPRIQPEYGILPQSIDCKPTLQLMLKPHGYDTACMLESSISNMLERGWQASTIKSDELNRLG